ncbi:MAG: N-acetylneuraminate synthase [Legionellales bacterium]|nr:N-acetylneuraminate synthase [Legionellales bacterium]
MKVKVNNHLVGEDAPVYFIADIAANHDGSLERAKELITLAKEAGADAAKFQHHNVKHYVSKKGFDSMSQKLSHQSKWGKSVFEVYEDAQVPTDWTPELKAHCDAVGIDFFSTPYDLNMIDHLDQYVPAYKIGSGDIDWADMLKKVSSMGKPVFLATGAANMSDVELAVEDILSINKELVLMQCNTNYTGNLENFKYINLRVLETYRQKFPGVILGLSDHTPGHATVLGAVALGAKAVEKHFTDDCSRSGPDHPFSMDPKTWREMVDRCRELELALGSFDKTIQENEMETVIVQRRCLRAGRSIVKGEMIQASDLEFQRPATEGSWGPRMKSLLVGKKAKVDIEVESTLTDENVELV